MPKKQPAAVNTQISAVMIISVEVITSPEVNGKSFYTLIGLTWP